MNWLLLSYKKSLIAWKKPSFNLAHNTKKSFWHIITILSLLTCELCFELREILQCLLDKIYWAFFYRSSYIELTVTSCQKVNLNQFYLKNKIEVLNYRITNKKANSNKYYSKVVKKIKVVKIHFNSTHQWLLRNICTIVENYFTCTFFKYPNANFIREAQKKIGQPATQS